MVAEILSIGTELLLGQIVDTNAAYLGRTLAGLGIDLYYKSTVGDNEARVIETIRRARDRADLIITSGGIGPTEDDLTKESIAQVFDEELVLDQPSLEHLHAFFARRGYPMPERNAKQAMIYRSGRMIPNPNGTAPGALLEKNGKIVISMPGPPNEMIPMMEGHVIPLLTERLGGTRQYLVTRVVRFIGIGESALEEHVQDLIHSTNPSLAPLAHTGEVHLRIGAKGENREAAEALIQPVEAELRRRLGKFIYGVDKTTLEAAVVQLLRERGRTVACAESCTGGGLGARLTSVSGSSAAFQGGVISYSNEAKTALLGVPRDLLETHGAVSAPVAEAMARGARERLGADYALSITGVAGPDGGTSEKPVGLVYIGVATPERVFATENHFIGIREDVRRRSTQVALQLLREQLLV
jgi:nicotinamide-nucleotide amidase